MTFCSNFGILYSASSWRETDPRPAKPDSYSHVLLDSQEVVVQRFDQLLDAGRHAEIRETDVGRRKKKQRVSRTGFEPVTP